MIFKELADLVLLAVNGGQFTSESAVQRPEVNSFIPAAAHQALQEYVFRMQQEKRADRSSSGFGSTILDGSFYTTFILAATLDEKRKAYYIELPGAVQSIPGIHSIESIFPKGLPGEGYTIVHGPSGALNLGEVMPSAWHEIHGTKTRIYFDALPKDACDTVVRAVMEVASCLGDEPLAIPRAYELRIIDLCVAHFRGQRQTPADGLIDNHDVNAITAKQ